MKSSKLSLKAKIMCGLLAGGMALSAASSAFAATEKATDTDKSLKIEHRIPMDKNKFNKDRMEEMNKVFEAVLTEAVSSNLITQDESDKIKTYVDKKAEEAKQFMAQRREAAQKEGKKAPKDRKMDRTDKQGKQRKPELFAELVDEGILTQEKADALREKMHQKAVELKDAKLKEDLSKLVENKTITQEQADKIASAIKTAQDTKKADFEKFKDMSEEERKEYIKNLKNNHTNPIKSLIEDGTITEEQAKEIRKTLPGHPQKHHKPGFKGKMNKNMPVQENTNK
ncbi:hypothetical protein [Clostridium ganghwense]|uniref:DUF2680 domain-containing protein n=1 Tax=Clostridium ganghwense TaxID=312089 RepID=A0ABT4CKA0_9CLOT|nr:hypothetical protein [Clostridium ganghwense]MCY6369471.1 hypothetical protein [Clostridium ganghwense]